MDEDLYDAEPLPEVAEIFDDTEISRTAGQA